MVSKVKTLDSRLLRRRCVACGYDGSLLKDGLAPRCARCGCDLRKRPARSYVEMEGLVTRKLAPQPWPAAYDEPRVLNRWLAFLFLIMVGAVTLVYLCAATFTV